MLEYLLYAAIFAVGWGIGRACRKGWQVGDRFTCPHCNSRNEIKSLDVRIGCGKCGTYVKVQSK